MISSKIIECLWHYTINSANNKFVIVLPYLEDTDGSLLWNEEKLAFPTLKDAEEYCTKLGVPLVSSED